MASPTLPSWVPSPDRLSGLVAFDQIQAHEIGPTIQALLQQAYDALERSVSAEVAADYDALSAVLDVATERLGRAWGAISHLNSVANTPEIRAAYNEQLSAVTAFYTALGADRRLYAKVHTISRTQPDLTPARRQALKLSLRDFRLSGAELEGEARDRFAAVRERRAALSQQFSESVLDATDAFTLDVSMERLQGVPPDVVQAARSAAQAAGRSDYRLTLHAPCYVPIMQYASDRALREQMYRAYVTRASELGPAEQDNSAAMIEQLQLRQEEAALLGMPTFADLSVASKMARSPQEVLDFLRDLAQRALPHGRREAESLREFARTSLALEELQAWDVAFASERLKEAQFAYSETEVKAYFTVPRVLKGLFDIIQTLFEVRIVADAAPVWHESVQFFRIERGPASSPQTVAHFYLDLYARTGKRPGAWMDDARGRWLRPDVSGHLQTPVAHLVCNFAAPQADQPSMLTHREVITLFHEFGHGLHHMLTQVQDLAVAGINGVEWDAVELPSQFMENFCWEWDVVRGMSGHVTSGQSLPRELFDKMLAARNFHSALGMLRQLEFALFDMELHVRPRPTADDPHHIRRVLDEVRSEVCLLPVPEFNRFAHAFSHIFAGGYAAGYYSYKWAEVLSADAFAAFEESGVIDVQTGRRYRQEILEAGGSRSAMENFQAFRGREPRIDALLRHQGIA